MNGGGFKAERIGKASWARMGWVKNFWAKNFWAKTSWAKTGWAKLRGLRAYWFHQWRSRTSPARLRLVDSLSLGERRFAGVLELEGRRFLIGTTPHAITLLAELAPESSCAEPGCAEPGAAPGQRRDSDRPDSERPDSERPAGERPGGDPLEIPHPERAA